MRTQRFELSEALGGLSEGLRDANNPSGITKRLVEKTGLFCYIPAWDRTEGGHFISVIFC